MPHTGTQCPRLPPWDKAGDLPERMWKEFLLGPQFGLHQRCRMPGTQACPCTPVPVAGMTS